MHKNTLLDHALIQSYLDNIGGAAIDKMMALYIQHSSSYIDNINMALKQQSQTQWQEHCHKMKGAAASMGLLSVHSHLVSIEQLLEGWEQKEKHLIELTALNQQAINNFKQWLAIR